MKHRTSKGPTNSFFCFYGCHWLQFFFDSCTSIAANEIFRTQKAKKKKRKQKAEPLKTALSPNVMSTLCLHAVTPRCTAPPWGEPRGKKKSLCWVHIVYLYLRRIDAINSLNFNFWLKTKTMKFRSNHVFDVSIIVLGMIQGRSNAQFNCAFFYKNCLNLTFAASRTISFFQNF